MSSHVIALLLPEYCSEFGNGAAQDEFAGVTHALDVLTATAVSPTALCASKAPQENVVPPPPMALLAKYISVIAPGNSNTVSKHPLTWHHVGDQLSEVARCAIDVQQEILEQLLASERKTRADRRPRSTATKKTTKRRRLTARKSPEVKEQVVEQEDHLKMQLDARYAQAATHLHHLMNAFARFTEDQCFPHDVSVRKDVRLYSTALCRCGQFILRPYKFTGVMHMKLMRTQAFVTKRI